MKWKKILVVYFSRSGHTKKFAENIAHKFNCDIEELKTVDSYSGFIGYQRALIQALFNKLPALRELKRNLADYDLIIVGGPIWGSSISSPIRSFLTSYKNNLKNVAFFSTQGGIFGEKRLIKQMKKVCGITPAGAISITEKDLSNKSFRDKILTFISRLQREGVKHDRKRARRRTPYAVAHAQH